MPKMQYFSNKFSKIAKLQFQKSPSPLTFDISDLKFGNFTKL